MSTKGKIQLLKKALQAGGGMVRLAPTWVPRAILVPGGRLKLAPQDRYALGKDRGGIDERWLASTTRADNGPGTPPDEGLSYIAIEDGLEIKKILLKEAMDLLGEEFLGKDVMRKHDGWKVLTKFFDNLGPIPHHLHQGDEHARKVGQLGKPEAYYFPPQLNFNRNSFPYTFFGLEPGTTRDEVRHCLENWDKGDNGILNYSKAYKLNPGTGWDIPPGILHAPGSLVTYEPQRASDVCSVFQSMVEGCSIPRALLVKDVPKEYHYDLDYLISLLDWDLNVDPEFMNNRCLKPRPVEDLKAMEDKGYVEKRIVYGSDYFSAKELTVFPNKTVTIRDEAAYGLIVLQGRGLVGKLNVETPTLIRFGELTADELFVTASVATNVSVTNSSRYENLIMLKHFGPG